MHDTVRLNSATAGAGGQTGEFREVTEDDTDYLVNDVVAQREGVYTYPDPYMGIRREFVPSEELTEAIEEVESVPIIVDHPEADEGPNLLKNPRVNDKVVVGEWRDLRRTDDGSGIAGKTFIDKSLIGEVGGRLKRYIDSVRRTGTGGVSTGYDLDDAERSNGQHNGEAYQFVQRGLNLDHLALLPDEEGDCPIDGGCGLGRANEDGDDGDQYRIGHIRSDEVTEEDSGRENTITRLGHAVVDEVSDSRLLDLLTGSTAETTPAESGKASDDLSDEERINELVEDHGLTRETLAPLKGHECLTRIHNAFTEGESSPPMGNEENESENGGTSGDENGDEEFEIPDSEEEFREFIDETVEDRVEDRVEEQVGSAVDEAVGEAIQDLDVEDGSVDIDDLKDDIAEDAAARANQQRDHEQNVETVAQSDEFPNIDHETAERMNEDVVSDLAVEARESDDGGQEQAEVPGRANRAGVPVGGGVDLADLDGSEGPDVPAPGRTNHDPSEGGDD